ncbi:MAG: YiiX/YebB-like N1pC/P60 family cysteine hydrolase [Planctomycetota bacterium]
MDSKKTARFLHASGLIICGGSIALLPGYYLGDRGTRWFPVMADILLICIFSGLSFLLISTIISKAKTMTGKQLHIRKRIVLLMTLLAVIPFVHLASCQLQTQTPLTTMSSDEFQYALSQHLELLTTYDKEMEHVLERLTDREDLFSQNSANSLTQSQETFLRDSWLMLYDYSFAIHQIGNFYSTWHHFDCSRRTRRQHVQSFLISYTADVILYEKALRTIALIKQNETVVTFLNAPHPGHDIPDDSFSYYQQKLFGIDFNARIQSGRAYLRWLENGLRSRTEEYAGQCLPLWNVADSRIALLDKTNLIKHSKEVIDADFELVRQGINDIWFPAQKGVAEWMGDTRVRRAGKYLITSQLQDELNLKLEPGDIMISRKNWYMSNVGLPGFWPHAILYLGEPEKMIEYFDTDAIREHLKNMTGHDTTFQQYMSDRFGQKWLRYLAGTGQSDYHVIEAIKYGVVLNPLSKACGDYMAAFRPCLDKTVKAQAIINAFGHLDKPYDFDFDFATDHVLVCTELVWRCYRPDTDTSGLNFQTVEIGGRQTLPANEIAKFFVSQKDSPERQLDFVCFVDACEKDEKAFFSDEKTFVESVDRSKWSFLQN